MPVQAGQVLPSTFIMSTLPSQIPLASGHDLCTAILVTLLLAVPATAQKRVALVMGNSAYSHAGVLTNPANDANDVAVALKDMGFEVIVGLDFDKRSFDLKVRDFSRVLAEADTACCFMRVTACRSPGATTWSRSTRS